MLMTHRLWLIALCNKLYRPPIRLRRRLIALKVTQQNFILNLVGLSKIFEREFKNSFMVYSYHFQDQVDLQTPSMHPS